MAATKKDPVVIDFAGPLNAPLSGLLTWVDQRFPMMSMYKDHLANRLTITLFMRSRTLSSANSLTGLRQIRAAALSVTDFRMVGPDQEFRQFNLGASSG